MTEAQRGAFLVKTQAILRDRLQLDDRPNRDAPGAAPAGAPANQGAESASALR